MKRYWVFHFNENAKWHRAVHRAKFPAPLATSAEREVPRATCDMIVRWRDEEYGYNKKSEEVKWIKKILFFYLVNVLLTVILALTVGGILQNSRGNELLSGLIIMVAVQLSPLITTLIFRKNIMKKNLILINWISTRQWVLYSP